MAIVVAGISSVIGFLVASSYVRRKPSRAEWLLIALALITPELPIAVSLHSAFAALHWDIPDILAVSLGQIGFPSALTILFVYLRLDASKADALIGVARTLGAKSAAILVLLLRLSWPAVTVGFLNAAAFSLQDVAYPWFLASANFAVLPTLVFSRARFGLQPWMIWYGALAAFCGALVAIIVFSPEVQLEQES
ncbi:MAG TPA: hypothetical protein VKZ53_22925 [Candidatus Angelobacter sp.]|nr:hypothetical protein [Candidatus Angelobacter sp.]